MRKILLTLLLTPLAILAMPAGLAQAPDRAAVRLPGVTAGGADLPNGWRITPAGKAVATLNDLVTNLAVSPDGKVLVAVTSGFTAHTLVLLDARTDAVLQRIELPATFLGLSWSPDGQRLYVSGGNSAGAVNIANPVSAIYELKYSQRRLTLAPGKFVDTADPEQAFWSGIALASREHRLYAANRGTRTGPGRVVVFDTDSRQVVARIPVEITPYQVVITADDKWLFVSNSSSGSVSVIDIASNRVIRTIQVGSNPNDMKISADGRLFVACANDNTVHVIDTRALQVTERVSTTLTPLAPEGSTPDALAIDERRKLLYVANADNNSLAVVRISSGAPSSVLGFIPTGWYPSALAVGLHNEALYIGNAKGQQGHADPTGPFSPLAVHPLPWPGAPIYTLGDGSVHTLQTSSLERLPLAHLEAQLPSWTRQVAHNTPYRDSLLSEAPEPQEDSVIPRAVGVSSPIQHVIYIIKENRTYDQVFGDLPNANGDPRLAIFGEQVTPNQHRLAREYVTLDNLYCDGEVSADGHFWSTAAYATDFLEKLWPAVYSRKTQASYSVAAARPRAGFLWDQARRKGLTYRNYEEGTQVVTADGGSVSIGPGPRMGEKIPDAQAVPAPGRESLTGHVAKDYYGDIYVRDDDRLRIFLREFKEYEAHYDSADPNQRLPNLITMRLPEDHTLATLPGWFSPAAMVANNDHVIGQLVEAVSHSRYWPSTALFIIEDDAQDGPDHVDARRTVGLVISPYVRRGVVDHALYSTSSMVRTIELLLGLAPMSQYDAAARPMYASFGTTPILTPFTALEPLVDVNARNPYDAYGARESAAMDLTAADRAPMHLMNEIIWKSVRGPDAPMPAPVHRFRPLIDASGEGGRGEGGT